MRPVWATRLEVYPAGDQSVPSLFDSVVATSHAAMRERALGNGVEMGEDYRNTPPWRSPDNRRQIEARWLRADDQRAWQGILVHPVAEFAERGEDIERRAEVQLRQEIDRVVVTIRLKLGSNRETIEPIYFDQQPPALIGYLLEQFSDVRLGDQRIYPAEQASEPVHPNALLEELNRQSRSYPVVVIACRDSDQIVFDTTKVADALLAVAPVRVLRVASDDAVQNTLNRSVFLSPLVRLYWPSFAQSDGQVGNELVTIGSLDSSGDDLSFVYSLTRAVHGAAAIRIASDEQVRDLARKADLQVLSGQVEDWRDQAHLYEAEFDDVDALIRNIGDGDLDAMPSLRDQVAHLRDQAQINKQLADEAGRSLSNLVLDVSRLSQDVSRLTATNASLQLAISARSQPERQAWMRGVRDFATDWSLSGMLRFIEDHSDPEAILVLPRAYDIAEDYTYQGSSSAWIDMFFSLIHVAHDYHAGELDKQGWTFEKAFQEQGFTGYRETTQQTQDLYRDKYTVTYDDGSGPHNVLLGPHLAVGRTAPYLLRAYWYSDRANRRFVIGHVGPHLPTWTARH